MNRGMTAVFLTLLALLCPPRSKATAIRLGTSLPMTSSIGAPTAALATLSAPVGALSAVGLVALPQAMSALASKHDAPAPTAVTPNFDDASAAPALEKEHILDLRTTQFSVGMWEVAKKRDAVAAMSDDKADAWLRKHAVPVVLRNGVKYMIDHHHESRAAWEAGIKHVYTYTIADLSHLTDDKAFWAEMAREEKGNPNGKKSWVHLFDQFGAGPHHPNLLPTDVRGLADEPERSVAGEVRDAGGYQKNTTPFSEFIWANFFRPLITLRPINDHMAAVVSQCMQLAKSAAAKGLPGWTGSDKP